MPGRFVTIFRQWRIGDRVVLELPRTIRLQSIDAAHPEVVALLCGPLVLFPIIDNGSPLSLSRAQLLAAQQTQDQLWEAGTAAGSAKFRPYTAIDDEQYSTYLRAT